MKKSQNFEDECITQSEEDDRKQRTRPQSFFENSVKNSNVENEVVGNKPEYNFEEMIEKALQRQTGPPVPLPKSNKAKTKKGEEKENEEL